MIYLDSCIVIYAVESADEVGDRVRQAITGTTEVLAISPLVIHEALIRPTRAEQQRQARMESALTQFELVELDLSAYVRAAELRAQHPGLRAPDALHLAAAERSGCTRFWTNDKRLATASRGLSIDIVGA